MEESASRVAVEEKAVGAVEQPDMSEPSPERQAEFRAAYEVNIAAGKEPYAGVRIQTLGEVLWIQRERGWSTAWGMPTEQRINLSGADLSAVTLSGADLSEATLSGADLAWANLSEAHLEWATLSGANLSEATLSGADFSGATLSGANLSEATLSGAHLKRANLSGADLRGVRLDEKTSLVGVVLDTKTKLGDVFWGGAALTRLDWSQMPRLGDEQAIQATKTRDERIADCQNAARAYRGLAIALRAQGLLPPASGYRLREQRLERKAAWHARRYGEWLFSALLDLVAGYGEALERILISYVVVVGGFAAAYWGVTNIIDKGTKLTKLSALSWDEALVLSLTSFHGRGFFPGFLSLGDWVARLGALEAVIGLFIELILIATFSRRFLGN